MIQHNGEIQESFVFDDYQAACSCGWMGTNRRSREAAEIDLKGHYSDMREGEKRYEQHRGH